MLSVACQSIISKYGDRVEVMYDEFKVHVIGTQAVSSSSQK